MFLYTLERTFVMTQALVASLWAAGMIAAALGQRLGCVGENTAEALFMALLVGAVASLGLAQQRGCCR